MNAARRLRAGLVDAPGSLGARSRLRRWERFADVFGDIGALRVIDLGGTVQTWLRAPVRPRHVTVLNLGDLDPDPPDWITQVRGDACVPPEAVGAARFDLVFSNSLLEHVGGHARRVQLGQVITKLAERHWVQTPYRYFPVEPHYLFPALQFLPIPVRARLLRHWPLTHSPVTDATSALEAVFDVELLSVTELAYYLPGSDILRERVAGITKSLVAVRA